MAERIRMRMTATYEYWADPANYQDADPAAMALNDLEGFIENGLDGIDDLVITVGPVTA